MVHLKRFIFFIFVFNSLCRIVLADAFPGSSEDRMKEVAPDTAKVTVCNDFSYITQDMAVDLNSKEKELNEAILSDDRLTIANAFCSIGKFYMQIDLTIAEKYFREAYETALEAGLIDMQAEALSGLGSISTMNGDYPTALQYLNQYQVIKDSMTVEENRRNIQKLTIQYGIEKAEKEKKEILKAQLEQQQQAIRQQKTIVIITSFALALIIILLGFVYRSDRKNKKINVMLEKQHKEIISFNDELQKSNHELFTYKDTLEEMVKEQTARLRQSEIQLRNLSDHLPGGCIYRKHVSTDGKEMISYVSNTVNEWLGLSVETMISDIHYFYRQIIPEDLQRKQQLERENLATMTPYACEYRLMKGAREVWLLENTMPHLDKNRCVVWDAIIVDITARKNFECELIQARKRAEESGMLKSSFLANMSHEIRTPMNGILGFLSFIGQEDLSTEKRLTYTRIIRNNIQQLLQLIGDIIDISKIDAYQLSLHGVTFDLNSLLAELEIFFQDFILKRDKKMELLLDRKGFVTPCVFDADPVRLRQILTNLVGNAVKFTEKGYIRFGYRLVAKRTKLLFFVEDTGIGIQPAKQKIIFERFEQALGEETRIVFEGTGLGLAISKNLVEMMGGQIGVRSKAGEGSTFYFTLPVNQ